MSQFYPLLFTKLELYDTYVYDDSDGVFKDGTAKDLEGLLKNDKLGYL